MTNENQENLNQTNQQELESQLPEEQPASEEKITRLWTFWTFIVLAVVCVGLLTYWGISSLPEKTVTEKDLDKGETQKYLIVATRECRDLAERLKIEKVVAKTDIELYVVVNLSAEQEELVSQKSCVKQMTSDIDEAKSLISSARNTMKDETERDIKENKMERTILKKDIVSKEELIQYLREKHKEIPVQPEQTTPGVISSYQTYVTPNDSAVSGIAQSQNGYEAVYNYGTSNWVWVSDEVLYGQAENWVLPNYFLTQTPALPSNPVPNQVAGDCEEQANALASTLRADGMPADEVRVVLGLVNFSGQVGGHAWVEVYVKNQWIPLDATSGPYYDNGQYVNVSGLPADYFATHEFPVLQNWFYYNDQYYHDVEANSGNAPSHWQQGSGPSFEF